MLTGVPAAMLPKTDTLDELIFDLSNPPLITLGVKELNISLALAFSGSFTTSKALALCAKRFTKPLSSKALINSVYSRFRLEVERVFHFLV